MRFTQARCPECGELAKGTVETLTGLAQLDFDPDGHAEYNGSTDVDYDNQRTVSPMVGLVTLSDYVVMECPDGHHWVSKLEEDT